MGLTLPTPASMPEGINTIDLENMDEVIQLVVSIIPFLTIMCVPQALVILLRRGWKFGSLIFTLLWAGALFGIAYLYAYEGDTVGLFNVSEYLRYILLVLIVAVSFACLICATMPSFFKKVVKIEDTLGGNVKNVILCLLLSYAVIYVPGAVLGTLFLTLYNVIGAVIAAFSSVFGALFLVTVVLEVIWFIMYQNASPEYKKAMREAAKEMNREWKEKRERQNERERQAWNDSVDSYNSQLRADQSRGMRTSDSFRTKR